MDKEERDKLIDKFWQEDFYDILKVFEYGEKKHPRLEDVRPNWMEPDGSKSSFNEMHASMFRHLAESHTQWYNDEYSTRGDHETQLDPLLHLACRALMMYYRIKHGINHIRD